MATQEERRAQTRQALLDAGATLFADLGVAGASVDAIAKAAGRTSGALYDHFGSKEGLLFALLQSWVGDAAALIEAEQATATSLDEWVAAMWHAVSDPPSGDGRWIALEHELWSYAARNDEARAYLARRYRVIWDQVNEGVAEWSHGDTDVAPALIGTLLGLEMMRRVDPDAVPDELAVAALRGVVTSRTTRGATTT